MLSAKTTLTILIAGLSVTVANFAREFTEAERKHWSLQKLADVSVPATRQASANPIDSFVLRKLEDKGLSLSAPADKAVLIRRATFDLIGLPPTPEEVENFLGDQSAEAFEKVVDRLLLSPHYGERWARHWLDLARYAESEGFKADETRPNVWRYRDYVVKSFNADKPYDRFLAEQIAGDELWPDDPEARVATGFNRHYPDESNARNLMQRRQEILNDITDTVGAVFTGLTFGCARCHDHKFDPILHKDYYRLQAFFANAAANDSIPLLDRRKLEEHGRRLAEWEAATAGIRAKMEEIEAPKRQEILDDYIEKYPAEIQAALLKRPEERSPFEGQMVAKAELYIKPASHQYIAPASKVAAALKGEKKKEWEELNSELKKFAHLHPGPLPIATGLEDLGEAAPKTYVLKGGAWDAPLNEVEPGFLSILGEAPTPVFALREGRSTGRRSALARLLTAPENPLTARVIVNRVWQYHFAQGIAATTSDLGFKGDPPTHPELLDWLAREFVEQGWSLKRLHKQIMLSAVYQQSSQFRAEAAQADPDNKLLWRYPRQRLEGEVIRDAALAVSGLLNTKMGGPSVYPELPSGMNLGSYGGWQTSSEEERNRRSIYVFVKRNLRYPIFETFDMPDTHESCARRNNTTSPLQALTMMNNKVTLDWAQAFATRVLAAAGTERSRQVQEAYQLAFSRKPAESELRLAEAFFAEHQPIVAERELAGAPLALPKGGKLGASEAATLVDFCHMLLNSNEFVYVN
jgi:hypothetical protein